MKTAFVIVCSSERLDQFKVLNTSIKKYIPNVDVCLYYGGKNNPELLNVTNIKHWIDASIYKNDLYTYCSVRARCVLDALSKGYDAVILLGSDTEFFQYPELCFKALETNDMFVTMYTHESYEGDDLYPNDLQTLEVGQINADLVGFKNTPKVIKFLEWLDKRTTTQCVCNGRDFVDQVWMSMCFSFLDKVEIIRHLGYNVANYNMHNRNMYKEDVWKMKDGTDLVLFHYAGFIKGQEENISKHQNRYKASGELLEFLKDYTRKLNEN